MGWHYDSRLSEKAQVEIAKFSRKVTKGLSKPRRKWIGEITYGILKSKDIKLTNIGRALRDDIDLKYTVKRHSRNLSKKDISREIIDGYLPVASRKVKKDTILSLDLSDISKKEAKKMDKLCKPWDGSKGRVSDKGYWLLKIVGKNLKGEELIPLYEELFSTEADDFRSENKQILKAVDLISRHTHKKGIWTIDRGGDRRRIYEGLLKREQKFIVRLIGSQRHLEDRKGTKDYPINIAGRMKLRCKARLDGRRDHRAITYNIRFGYTKVFLPKRKTEFTMVVVKGFGKEPMMLFTNIVVHNKVEALQIIRGYIARWIIEESFRFLKQSYSLEDIRLRRYNALRNMAAVMTLVYGFLSIHLLLRLSLRVLAIHIYERAKRLYGIPPFSFYALADGLLYILAYYRQKFSVFSDNPKVEGPPQLLLFSFAEDWGEKNG